LIDRLLALLSGNGADEEPRDDDVKLAVAALLIEAGRMDERFDAGELRLIRDLLTTRFDMDRAELDRTVTAAEQRVKNSEQYYPFTDVICKRLSGAERVEIIEMLWRVVYADGVLDAYEDALIRQVAALIHVEDRDRAAARQRALAAQEVGKQP
jgi:uncharacterized tellurite resistance protein B-like protein